MLARRPEVVCIDDLTAGTTTAERRFAAARRLADAGITVVGTVQLGRLGGRRWRSDATWTSSLLALADEIELVDVPPSILMDRVRRGEIVPARAGPEQALATTFAPETLRAERERAFRLVAEHGERRLAAYTGRGSARAAGRAGAAAVDRGLRRAVAWHGAADPAVGGAGGAGRRRVPGRDGAAVAAGRRQPEDQLLAGYAALTEQLGGEFVALTGPAPAQALAEYAGQRAGDRAGAGPGAPESGQAGTRCCASWRGWPATWSCTCCPPSGTG